MVQKPPYIYYIYQCLSRDRRTKILSVLTHCLVLDFFSLLLVLKSKVSKSIQWLSLLLLLLLVSIITVLFHLCACKLMGLVSLYRSRGGKGRRLFQVPPPGRLMSPRISFLLKSCWWKQWHAGRGGKNKLTWSLLLEAPLFMT